MTSQQQQLLISLLTIVGSGVVSAYVTYRLNSRKEERQFRRQKLEQVFLASQAFQKAIFTHISDHLQMMKGRLTANQVHDLIIKRGADPGRPGDNLEMLVVIYFPRLQPTLDHLWAIREAANDVIAEYEQENPNGGRSDSHGKRLYAEMGRMVEIEKTFTESIRKEAGRWEPRHARPWSWRRSKPALPPTL
jgi:hypothetical protein